MSKVITIQLLLIILSCAQTDYVLCNERDKEHPWEKHGKLRAGEGTRYIRHEDGTPFLWIGCSAWGMTELLSREEVELYLDDRKAKGMNVVQLCLFWGNRKENPLGFTANAPNYYGFKALTEKNKMPDPLVPDIKEGGSPEDPDDYWDHVDFCLNAIKERGMYAAVLPFWGRRYVNASHPGFSKQIFTLENIFEYGSFLGKRYGKEPHIIWVNGGDVEADSNGDFRPHYRLLAEGIAMGATGKRARWDQDPEIWNKFMMTYHPSGAWLYNSSQWFHEDKWLTFNMIETHIMRNQVVAAIKNDLNRKPLKPTVLGEGHYEGFTNKNEAKAIHIRRQAWQTFFSGACGFTYGGAIDSLGNGPLFSPSNNWTVLLNWEGAQQLIHLKKFLVEKEWWKWMPANDLITEGKGKGELEKLAVSLGNKRLIYFPDNSSCKIQSTTRFKNISWYETKTGILTKGEAGDDFNIIPPKHLEDCVLILE